MIAARACTRRTANVPALKISSASDVSLESARQFMAAAGVDYMPETAVGVDLIPSINSEWK
ncbi:hypothetical protein CA13_64760 [Planctomycetes bacterium CA13]|uniref:Uncharacterized protein n=1 Tax=Novipirellula herctigrandis TaxID=2527986 RepID=A0A5C5ZCE5_9BACT|nr:hypothetical protein CA13_64760 [Planctomycetes bacterium CA13]